MTTHTVVKTSEWVERARALAAVIAQWRDAGEQERHVPRPLFEALRDAGIFSMSAPKAVGGAEVEEEAILQVIEELARHDGSVGWNVMIASNTAIIASYLPAAALREVYRGGPNTVIAGALPPKGAAMPVSGGFSLTGRWTFASGCHQADWMQGTSAVMAHGTPRLRPDGRPDIRAFFVPVGVCEILDTWHTAGLRGTGSHDWQVTDIFVPEERSFPILFDGPSEPGCLSIRDFGAYAGPRIAAVALGIARDAIDAFRALAMTKTPLLATSSLATQHTTHERVGRAEALLRAGRAFLYETVRALPYSPTWSEALGDDCRAGVRLASTHAAQNAAEAVDLMFNAAGTTSIYASSRLERCFRDVHVATQHIAVAPSNIEMVGHTSSVLACRRGGEAPLLAAPDAWRWADLDVTAMTTRSRIDVASRRVAIPLGGLLMLAMALLTASPARGETATPVDVSFFDDARKLKLTGHLYQPGGSGPFPVTSLYFGVYVPLRLIEWTIMALLISRGPVLPEGGIVRSARAWLWVLGGVGVSFATDLASPEGMAGRFCVGRCLC